MTRRVARWAALLALTAACTAMASGAAIADPPPATCPPAPTTGCLPQTPTGGAGEPSPSESKPLPESPSRAGHGGILGPFTVPDRNGIGIDHYDIVGDDGGTFDFSSKILLLFSNIFFYVCRVWTGFTAWLTDWALRFALVDVVRGPASDLVSSYDTGMIGPLGLRHLFLTLAGAWCALLVFRGKVKQGIAEAAVTLLISALAVTALANPVGLLLGPNGLMTQTRDVSVEVASIGLSHGQQAQSDPDVVSRPVTDALVDTLIRKPHEILNFGAVLDDPHHPDRCLDTYNGIVAMGPTYGRDTMWKPWDLMGKCNSSYADYSKDPTMDRTFGALFAMIASIIINILIDLVAIGLALTPVFLAFEAVLLLGGLVLAILPGAGRGLLYRRIGEVAGALAGVIAAAVFLTLFLTTIQAFLVADLGVSLPVRFLIVDVVAIAGWKWRKSLFATARHLGGNVGRRMETARTGGVGTGGWIKPAAAGLIGGYALAEHFGDAERSFRRYLHRAQLASYRARRRHNRAGARYRDPRYSAQALTRRHPGGMPSQALSRVRRAVLLDRTMPGRLLHRTARVGTAVGAVGLKYTVGAPVYVPRAASKARQSSARRAEHLRHRLAKARAFRTEYTNNLRTAAQATTRPARDAARVGITAAMLTGATTLGPKAASTAPPTQRITAVGPPPPKSHSNDTLKTRADRGAEATSRSDPHERLLRRLAQRRTQGPR